MWRAALVGLCVLGADTGPQKTSCSTPCGMTASLSEESCINLVLTEAAATWALGSEVKDFGSPQQVCSALNGWRVGVNQDHSDKECSPGWVEAGIGCVVGLSNFDWKQITLTDDGWMTNSLTHEIAHVADHAITKSVRHCGWRKRGILGVIRSNTGRDDTSDEDCEAGK